MSIDASMQQGMRRSRSGSADPALALVDGRGAGCPLHSKRLQGSDIHFAKDCGRKLEGMTDTPERPGESSEPTTEPTQAASEPPTEPTAAPNEPTPASSAAPNEPTPASTAAPNEPTPASTTQEQSRRARPPSRWEWLSGPKRLNRVGALVAIVAGAVFVTAAIFGTGVLVGAHSGGHREAFERSPHQSAMFEPHRGGSPIGQIWLVPEGAGPNGHGEHGDAAGYGDLGGSAVLSLP
jgi:hypothetical protein